MRVNCYTPVRVTHTCLNEKTMIKDRVDTKSVVRGIQVARSAIGRLETMEVPGSSVMMGPFLGSTRMICLPTSFPLYFLSSNLKSVAIFEHRSHTQALV